MVNEAGKTLSDALALVVNSPDLKETYFTTPLALASIQRPTKWHKGAGKESKGGGKEKGSGKGKPGKWTKGKTSDNALKGLVLSWRTPEGRDICFAYNLQGCDGKCGRLHVCRVKGCYQDRPAREHKQKAKAGGAKE